MKVNTVKLTIISLLCFLTFIVLFYSGNRKMDKMFWSNANAIKIEKKINKRNVNVKDIEGNSPLMSVAIYSQDPKIVNVLYKKGASFNEKYIDDSNFLMFACKYNNNPQFIEEIISLDLFDINAVDDLGNTALMYASRDNINPDIVELLIKRGAKKNIINDDGYNALALAVRDNTNLDVIKTLVNNGFKISYKNKKYSNRNLLMIAAENNVNPDVIDYLIEKKIAVNAQDDDGATAVILSTGNSNIEVMKRLIKHDANLKLKTKWKSNVLMNAVVSSKNIEMFDLLLEKGLNINERNSDGSTVLMYASEWNNDPKVIQYLLEKGANINLKNKYGITALIFASQDNTNVEILDILLKNTNIKNEKDIHGNIPLYYAAHRNKNPQIVNFLLDKTTKFDKGRLLNNAVSNENDDILIEIYKKYPGIHLKISDDDRLWIGRNIYQNKNKNMKNTYLSCRIGQCN